MNNEINRDYIIKHYARLALTPGWIDEARHSVMKLEKQQPELFAGLGAAVALEIASLKEAQKNGTSNE